jgi:antitoxin (DNA-binding transcriptional repressor) of toxin-antitoxin stability system
MAVIISATEARQKFFQLLRMVEDGEEVIITYQDSKGRFTITLQETNRTTKKQTLR